MKKMTGILLILALIAPSFFFPSMEAEAQTLADLKQQFEQFVKEKTENQQQQELTQAQINKIKSTIVSISGEIEQISTDLVNLQNEITDAEESIKKKDKEIKEIVNFLQVSSGESAYLEYAFGAKDFTDFIYRMAISEQLSSYNEELMTEYNALIESNRKKREEITKKREDLRKKQTELSQEESKLGTELQAKKEVALSIQEQIEAQKKLIEHYEVELKCNLNETITACENRNHSLPPGTAFYRPIESGRVSSEFTHRCYQLNGQTVCDNHKAIDVTESGSAVPIYASAPGVVADTAYRTSCGGNRVYINHIINGQKYTSFYAHLRNIYVKPGDVVTTDTQIATMGGNPSIETWDGCSSGQHLHFVLATGHFGIGKDFDYIRWTAFENNMFNPREMVNFPARGVRFENRLRKY